MKILALDTSSSNVSIYAENGNTTVSFSIDSGMRHSEKIVPAIALVLEQAEIGNRELDFCVIGRGPGSFTGLRLAFAAVKALSLASSCPVYGVPTLSAYAHPFAEWPGAVVAAIDAKKNKFYASVFRQKEEAAGPLDASIEEIVQLIDPEEKVLAAGPDAVLLKETLLAASPSLDIRLIEAAPVQIAQTLAAIGKQMHADKAPPLADYDGPVYLRKSEAEENRHT